MVPPPERGMLSVCTVPVGHERWTHEVRPHGNDASTHLVGGTMKHYLTQVLHALEARWSGYPQWSRLEREIAFDHHPDEDSSEMRRYLAAQASQAV